jgi:protein-S-isoprenylcysteine O-methyltransferase Ste14
MIPTTTRHWSDWVGSVACLAFAAALWRKAPQFGILLIPALLQELLVAISFLLRGRARSAAPGLAARAVAYAHAFLIMAFIWVAADRHPEWIRPTPDSDLRIAGALLWIAGALLSLWPLWHLRRSFGIEPVARTLVSSGPYRFARHPVYATYLLINAGMLLRYLTLPFAAVMLVWLALLAVRIRFEESVLARAFPEYEDYRRRVGALGPRLAALAPLRQGR